LSLAEATGGRLFRRLVAQSDVLIDCATAPRDSMCPAYEALRSVNPRLVMVSISAFGASGPYAGYKGNDLLSWHGSGTGHRFMGEADRAPFRGAWYHASHWGAYAGAAAVAFGLLARDRYGAGQHIDLAIADALALLFMAMEVTRFHDAGEAKKRTGAPDNPGQVGLVPCKDGWVQISAIAPHMWEGLVRAMGEPEWALDPKWAGTNYDRAPYDEELLGNVAPWLMAHTRQEIFERCQANRVPSGPLHEVDQLLKNEHLRARGYFVDVEHPAAGRIHVPGPPYKMGEERWRIDRPAPLLGEHNQQVYCGMLGLSRSDLVDLRRSGAI